MPQQQQKGGGDTGEVTPQPLGGASCGGGGFNDPNPQDEHQKFGDLGIAEAASPISCRPPIGGNINNENTFEEMMLQAASAAGGSGSSGNRWPRQETLALLQIRSEMDAAFRDATPKAPLWDQVSSKLAALGYKRSAKKCKEKFENVHKYYKRTKEGRGGRQDGKSYKFFTQLEALDQHHHISIPTATSVHPTIPTSVAAPVSLPPPITPRLDIPPQDPAGASTSFFGISFSSSTSSSSEDEMEEEDLDVESADVKNPHHRKRRRPSAHSIGNDGDEKMMEFFEGLMNKVMEKQEAMQHKFLEAMENREQDRMIREEAWKRQDMVRLAREHELMAQERAISGSRDAAIIAFLEKVTGQTINLPTSASQNHPTPPLPVSMVSPPFRPPQEQPTFPQPQQPQTKNYQLHDMTIDKAQPNVISSPRATGAAAAMEEQQQMMPLPDLTGGGIRLEASSSRWPKTEVLALIQLRSGMELKYQEVGPKGPLWEEISSGMERMGYNRSAKRCKEKWENINKYYKKVKESNKKRPEDSKTCPYFHELDALYQRKQHGSTSGNIIGSFPGQEKQQEEDVGMSLPSRQLPQGNESEIEGSGKTELQTSTMGAYSSIVAGEQSDQGDVAGAKQPEDMLEKQQISGDLIDIDCFNSAECSYSDQDKDEDNYHENDDNGEYGDNAHGTELKMAYKVQFQKLNAVSSNGGGTGTSSASTSFMAMVQ